MAGDKKFSINYIYFGLLLFFILGINSYSLFVTKTPVESSKWLLWIDVALQSLWEVTLFVAISLILQKYAPKFVFYLFLIFFWVIALFYDANFITERLMGTPFLHLLHIWFLESGTNFAEILKASNISIVDWITILWVLVNGAALGIVLFLFTDHLLSKRQWRVSGKQIAFSLTLGFIFIAVFDFYTISHLSYGSYVKYKASLPMNWTFASPVTSELPFSGNMEKIAKVDSTPEVEARIKPPIFLFILESVGEKYLDSTVTPNLVKFRDENISFEMAASGGNATMISWYSIFHSQYSLRWSGENARKMGSTGSASLSHLRELGYQIHLYASSELAFYQMNQSIFAKDEGLIDTVFAPSQSLKGYERDALVMEELGKDLIQYGGDGHFFVIFIDSPHFDYSFPKEAAVFTPIIDQINMPKVAHSSAEREEIINRYKNSLHYVDGLLGEFFQREKSKDSVIVITGDHGQEFYDMGNLFHASNLSKEQTRVPLYFRFGDNTPSLKGKASNICSHIDIFPTILDYLGQKEESFAFLDGESIFKTDRWPYAITSRYNGSMHPYEFCIHNTKNKMISRFSSLIGLPYSKKLYLYSIVNQQDEVIQEGVETLQQEFEAALSHIFTVTSQ